MYSNALLALLLCSLTILPSSLAATAHQPRRRHHHKAKAIMQSRDSCTNGHFSCDGNTLRQCSGSGWVTLQVCSSDTVCSAPNDKQANIGCLWPDQVSGSASATATAAPSSTAWREASAYSTTSTEAATGYGASWTESAPATATTAWGAASTAEATAWGISSGTGSTATSSAPAASGSSSSSGSKWVVYSDYPLISKPPTAADLGDITHFILAFWLSTAGAYDSLAQWTSLSDSERTSVKADYAANGKSLMVSAFGSTDTPTTSNYDPADTAKKLASFVQEYSLDGVDVDYEDFPAFTSGAAMPWLITFQQTLREQLPSPYIISHAPVAPWFTSASTYKNGGYRGIYESAGDGIDFFNVQFYNQGESEYTTCENLLYTSSSEYPGSALFEIASQGIPVSKLLIGKPSDSTQASNGYMEPELLSQCIKKAVAKAGSDFAGVMNWQWDTSASSSTFSSFAAAV